jgi:metal-responsive CopG/Arc/MetJ family transcriptional regulator
MKRTTIVADETLLSEVKALARNEQRSAAEIIREALTRYVRERKREGSRLSYLGVAASGEPNIVQQHERLLWKPQR